MPGIPTTRSGGHRGPHQPLRLAATMILLLCIGWPPPAPALSVSGVKNRMIEFLIEKVSVPGQFELAADRIEDNSAGGSTLYGVRISDGQGVWFKAQRFVLKWRAARLLRGEVHIDELSVHGGRLTRTPVIAEAQEPQPAQDTQSASGEWPRSPITMRVDKLEIRDMRISDAVLPQAIAFDANGGMQDEGDIQSLGLSIKRTDSIRGAIKLSYLKRFDTGQLNLQVNAAEGPGGMVAAAAGLPAEAPTDLVLRGSGTPTEWKGELSLALASLLTAKGQVAAHWQDRIGVNLAVDLMPAELLSSPLRAAIGEQAELDLEIAQSDGDIVRITNARVHSASIDARATGTYDRKAALLDMALHLQAKDDGAKRLSAVMPPAGFDQGEFDLVVKGPIAALLVTGTSRLIGPRYEGLGARDATLEFRLPIADGETARIDLLAKQPYGPDSDYAAAFGETLSLSMEFRRAGALLDQFDAELRAQHMAAGVKGRVQLGDAISPQLAYVLNVPDLAPFARIGGVDVVGGASARGTVSGQLGDLATAGDLRFTKLAVRGQQLGNMDIEHSTALTDSVSGHVALQMQSPSYGKGQARTRYRFSDAVLQLRELSADLLGLQANGELSLPLQTANAFDARGELALLVESLEPVGKLLGRKLSGSGDARLLLSPGAGGTANLAAHLSRFSFDGTSFDEARVDAKVTGLDTRFVTDAQLRGSGLKTPGLALQNFEARVKGPMSELDFDAVLSGNRLGQALHASLAGSSDWSKQPQTVRLKRFELNVAAEAITLAKASTISIGTDRTEIADLDLRFPDGGALSGSALLDAESATVELLARALPLRLAHAWFGAPEVSGTVDASLKGKTGGSTPGLAISAAVNSLARPADFAATAQRSRDRSASKERPELSASLKADWDGRELSGVSEISSASLEQPLKLSFAIPLRPGSGPVPVLDKDRPLHSELKWQGALAPIFALAPLPNDRLEGQLNIALDVSGTVSAPKVDGQLRLVDGRYENLLAGTQLRNLALDARFNENGDIRARLTADDGAEGTLNVEASTQLTQALEKLDVDVTIKQLLVVRLDAATAAISSKLAARGKPGGLKVSGQTMVDWLEIRLLNAFPPSATDLGPIVIDGDTSESEAVAKAAQPSNIELDLNLKMPDRAFVRGRGLESQWQGELTITGTTSTPIIKGSIDSKRGTFNLLGKVFNLETGRIGFDGGKKIDPDIDIKLVREGDEVTGTIALLGPSSDPELKFFSQPALPEDEVLPMVLFGRSRQSLSGAEALQLAAGVASLTRGETDSLDSAQQSLGIDVLRLENPDSDDEDSLGSLSVGKHVTEDVLVGVRQPLRSKNENSLFIEYRVFKRTILDAEFAADESKFGVRWRRKF